VYLDVTHIRSLWEDTVFVSTSLRQAFAMQKLLFQIRYRGVKRATEYGLLEAGDVFLHAVLCASPSLAQMALVCLEEGEEPP